MLLSPVVEFLVLVQLVGRVKSATVGSLEAATQTLDIVNDEIVRVDIVRFVRIGLDKLNRKINIGALEVPISPDPESNRCPSCDSRPTASSRNDCAVVVAHAQGSNECYIDACQSIAGGSGHTRAPCTRCETVLCGDPILSVLVSINPLSIRTSEYLMPC